MSLFKERSLINLNLTRSTKGFMKTRKYHLFLIRFFSLSHACDKTNDIFH